MTAPDRSRERPLRLLLVDDNPTNLKVLHDTLQGQEYELRAARSGEQALSIAARQPPDLILLDIMMPPGIDGYETIRRLKEDPALQDIPVIFLSALDDTDAKVKGFELGAVDYITKPFQTPEVIARVETHLTISSLRRQVEQRNRTLEEINRRLTQDLQAAARVQQALLPGPLPATDRCHFAWQFHPCDELAGDALDIQRIDDRFVLLWIVDVCGHGVPAALLSVAAAHSLSASPDPSCLVLRPGEGGAADPADVASRLNALYPMENNGSRYFTLVLGVLDQEERRLRVVTAGHPPPLLVRDGAVEAISHPCPPIGILPEAEYSSVEVSLQPGDRVYLYSDCMYEERNSEGELYGLERFGESLVRRAGEPLEAGLDGLRQDLATWCNRESFTDDLSIIGLEIL